MWRWLPVVACASFLSIAASEQAILLSSLSNLPRQPTSLRPTWSSSELLSLHKQLISIESISRNEKEVGDWLSSYLTDAGLAVEKQHLPSNASKDGDPNRFNVLAYPPGQRETRVLVSSHIDTVPPFWPYELREGSNGTEIWGRGSVDAKACVAAQTIAVLDLLSQGKVGKGDVGLLFVVGEEISGDGMRTFSEAKPSNYSAVVFGEPTEGKLASGHKGILGWKIKIRGKAAHSGYPSLGLSANEMLIEALNEMLRLVEYFPSSEKYGNSTMNIGLISGGVAANVVAETAETEIALRIANGTVSDITSMVAGQLSPLKTKLQDLGGNLTLEWTSRGYGVVDIDADVPGFDTITVNYGTDVPNLKGDHKRYLYGPGSILVAHSDHEHLLVKELEKAVDDYQKIILHALDK